MKQSLFEIVSNTPLTDSVYKMILAGDTSAITAPGQFVNIKLDGFFLRRPISVCDCDADTLTIIYKAVGKGTTAMSQMQAGQKLDILTGLGNGYDLSLSGDTPVLLGGGVGVPPMYKLAKDLIAQGKTVTVILGFNTQSECFYEAEFKALGCKVLVTTADGSSQVVNPAYATWLNLSVSWIRKVYGEPKLMDKSTSKMAGYLKELGITMPGAEKSADFA